MSIFEGLGERKIGIDTFWYGLSTRPWVESVIFDGSHYGLSEVG